MHTSLGTRMKENYESRYKIKLTRRTPVILRLDGKAFHTLTKYCKKPFDDYLRSYMTDTAKYLLEEIQGSECAYVQSDEISILLIDYKNLDSQAWFDYNLQKITSVSAGMASAFFSNFVYSTTIELKRPYFLHSVVVFDSRAFNIPKEEVCNYFVWRQKDWERNSIQMLARTYYSHKQLHGKNSSDIHEMLHEKEVNWADLDSKWKNGSFLYKDENGINLKEDIIFTKDRDIINNCVYIGE